MKQVLAIQQMRKLRPEEQRAKNGLRYKYILQKLVHEVHKSISQGENHIWPSPRYSTILLYNILSHIVLCNLM